MGYPEKNMFLREQVYIHLGPIYMIYDICIYICVCISY